MVKLNPISFKELVKNLRNLDFTGPYSGGKHLYMLKGNLRLTLPNPHKRDIGIDLLKRILRQAEISNNEWTNAFKKN